VENRLIRDGVVPYMTTAAASLLTLGVDVGLGSMGASAIHHAGAQGANALVIPVVHGQGLPSGSGVGFGHGVVNGADQVATLFQGDLPYSQYASLPSAFPAYQVGEMVGACAIQEGADLYIGYTMDPTRKR